MSFTRWLRNWRSPWHLGTTAGKRRQAGRSRPAACFRPRLEALEDRLTPSTLTVLNNLDSGAGSLRAEITAAHKGDTIVFAPSLDGQTITLTRGELLINKDLTIAGPGAGALTVSGNNASRVFDVAGGTVTLSGLTISNGLAPVKGPTAGYGGGIFNQGTLTVSNSTLLSNSTSNVAGGNGEGGGIYNSTSGTLTVTNYSTLSNNTAHDGGGIQSDGMATISGGTILSGNSAAYFGGGIQSEGTLTVSGGCTLSGNSARYGGGIESDGTTTINSCTLSGNSALTSGGGIYNGGTLTVSGCIVSSNVASFAGGGIANRSSGTVTVENFSNITGNTASAGNGADVANGGVLYLDASSIIGILVGNPAKPI
jgi:predicted outer membrane repeat protein